MNLCKFAPSYSNKLPHTVSALNLNWEQDAQLDRDQQRWRNLVDAPAPVDVQRIDDDDINNCRP